MLKTEIEKCTGCGACVQKCPQKCIRWQEKEFGFRYPVVDKKSCIDCGLCEKACPVGKKIKKPDNQQVFAAVYKNKEILKNSTSGGAFSAIAEFVLERKGTVYGCCMDSDMKVMHIGINSSEDISKLRGSKYVQSDVNDTFIKVKNDLENDLWVMYTGTPCQIAALYRYLENDYEKLITADIVCHGVGSQAYFDKYLEYARNHYGNIQELRFRSKELAGWTCGGGVVVTANEKGNKLKKYSYYNNYYYFYFLNGDIYRKSCYECPYANMQRQGDFSLGDFWGVEAYNLKLNTNNGCSLLVVNNDKAKNVIQNINQLELEEVQLEWAVRNNEQLNQPSKKSKIREELLKQYESRSAEDIQRLFLRNNRREVFKGFIKSKIPYRVKVILRRNMR